MDDTRPPGPEMTDRQGAHRGTGLRGRIRMELGVMFSRRQQPISLRVAKWAAFLAVARGLRGTRWFGAWAFGLPAAGLGAHLFYRRMTRGWTEPWGGWNDVDAARPRIEKQDLGGKDRRSLESTTGRRSGLLCHRGNLLLFFPLFYGTFVAASFFFGYMRIYTGSIWPASIAHAVHNAAWNVLGAVTLITVSPVLVDVYLVGDFGLLILIGTAIGAVWVGRRLKSGMDQAQPGAEVPRVAPAPSSAPATHVR